MTRRVSDILDSFENKRRYRQDPQMGGVNKHPGGFNADASNSKKANTSMKTGVGETEGANRPSTISSAGPTLTNNTNSTKQIAGNADGGPAKDPRFAKTGANLNKAGVTAGKMNRGAQDIKDKGVVGAGKDAAKDKAEKVVKKAAAKVARKVATQVALTAIRAVGALLANPVTWLVIGIVLLVVFVIFAVMFFWEHPAQALGLGIKVVAHTLGFGMNSIIQSGGASRLAYEVPVTKNGTAQAAISNFNPSTLPKVGTYAYKLSQIDWEKAKYQTLPNQSACNVKTQEVTSPDGKKRSVIASVEIKDNPGEDLIGVARANCLDNTYPVFNTVMRSQFIRDNINKKAGVRYAYAAPQKATDFDGKTSSEVDESLRSKSLARIWQHDGGGVSGYTETPSSTLAPNQLCSPGDSACITNLFVFFYTKDEVRSEKTRNCANSYDFTDPKTFDKAVSKAKHDLQCGVDPKDLKFMYSLPSDADLESTDPNKSLLARFSALRAMCEIYSRTQQDEDTAIQRYKKIVEDRISSEAVSSFQAFTYAHTNRDRFLDIRELSGDSYKVLGMGNAQEYRHDVDQEQTGQPIEADAASRVFGISNTTQRNGVIYNDKATSLANEVLGRLNTGKGSICVEILDQKKYDDLIAGVKDPAAASIFARIYGYALGGYYDAYYPSYKRAIATLDYYSKDSKGRKINIDAAAKKVTLEDLFTKQVRIESNASTAGIEEGTQNFNRMGIGIKAYKNAVSVSMGGSFIDENRAVAQEQLSNTFLAYDDTSRGVLWRLFDTNNPRSITSRVNVAFIDKPTNVLSNLASVFGNLFNPAKNLVGSKNSLSYMLTGSSHIAQAAESYEVNNLRIDPAGIPSGFYDLDSLQVASKIEDLKEKSQISLELFSQWDLCFQEYIPSRFHLLDPPPEKADLYKNYCRELFDIAAPQKLTDAEKARLNQFDGSTQYTNPTDRRILSFAYRAYHFYNIQTDALVYLSDPEKQDQSLNASSSALKPQAQADVESDAGEIDPKYIGVDTSALPCSGGSDAGIGDKKSPDGTIQYKIRLCSVQGIIVNTTIAKNLNDMITAAKAAGVTLVGGGYRTFESQAALRKKNGCPDNTSPSSTCRVPTAPIGKSMHESGEAIDFKNASKSGPVFKWLTQNAATYSFKNLPAESWHWSVNGR
ncbi:MAG: M15 family metallopeptidase [bacterium]